jgi:hypothetical protein
LQPDCGGTSSGRRQTEKADAGGRRSLEETCAASVSELIAPEANRVAEYTIELEGGTLRIHCKGATVMEFADLSRALQSAIR